MTSPKDLVKYWCNYLAQSSFQRPFPNRDKIMDTIAYLNSHQQITSMLSNLANEGVAAEIVN